MERIYKQIKKLIEDNKLTTNNIYEISAWLNRIYMDNLVKERILHFIDNVSPYLKEKKDKADMPQITP